MKGSKESRQEGAALFVAVMILALMGALGIMAFNTVLVDRQVAGFQNRARTAFYAAEAAASEGRSLVRTVGSRGELPALSPRALGDTALYDREFALPSYSGDPAFANPIRYIRDSGLAGGANLQMRGQKFVNTLWQINVQGQSPDGATTRIEVVETKTLASGY
jgi:Tfp pilus assembly protein PilX